MHEPVDFLEGSPTVADPVVVGPPFKVAVQASDQFRQWRVVLFPVDHPSQFLTLSRGLAGVPNYNNNAGGFLVGADYRLSENFAAGLFAGYEYSYAKYDSGSSTPGNSALFGLYGSYTHEDGYTTPMPS